MADHQSLAFALPFQRKHPIDKAYARDAHFSRAHFSSPLVAQIVDEKRSRLGEEVHDETEQIHQGISAQRHRVVDQERGNQQQKNNDTREDRALKYENMLRNVGGTLLQV